MSVIGGSTGDVDKDGLKFVCFMCGKFILLSAGLSYVFSAHLESNTTLVM